MPVVRLGGARARGAESSARFAAHLPRKQQEARYPSNLRFSFQANCDLGKHLALIHTSKADLYYGAALTAA